MVECGVFKMAKYNHGSWHSPTDGPPLSALHVSMSEHMTEYKAASGWPSKKTLQRIIFSVNDIYTSARRDLIALVEDRFK